MTPNRAVLSAKVPQDLRDAYETLATRDGHGDLSIPVRAALRAYAEQRLTPAPNLLSGGTGARRRSSTATEAAAALKVAARVGSQRRVALEHFEQAGGRGLTPDELVVLMAPHPHNGVARRVTDLKDGGMVAVVTAEPDRGILWARLPGAHRRLRPLNGLERAVADVVTRPTRAGARGTVYAITAAGARALEQARQAGR